MAPSREEENNAKKTRAIQLLTGLRNDTMNQSAPEGWRVMKANTLAGAALMATEIGIISDREFQGILHPEATTPHS